jgi:two-component system LytT family response regulator
MKILLIDDEEPARVEMRQLLSLHPEVEIVGEAADVATAVDLTSQLCPDLVFLDVQLAGETGFDYVDKVAGSGPSIVFVTAHDRFAVRGFECNALDYLLKPVHPVRLAESLSRMRSRLSLDPNAEDTGMVRVKNGASSRVVPWHTVQHIVSSGNYTRIHFNDGHSSLMLRSLKEWLELVPAGKFLQVHRTTLVRRDAIREVLFPGDKKCEIVLEGGEIVSVSRGCLAALRATLGIV